jgi:hypothetical protein
VSACLQFGIEQLSIHANFKSAAIGGNDGNSPNVALELIK